MHYSAQLRLEAASAQPLSQCSRLKASWGRASLHRQANSAVLRGPTRCLGLPLGCPCRCRCPRCRGCRRRCRRWLAAAPVGSAGRSLPAWCPASSASLLQVYREHTKRDEVSNCRSRGSHDRRGYAWGCAAVLHPRGGQAARGRATHHEMAADIAACMRQGIGGGAAWTQAERVQACKRSMPAPVSVDSSRLLSACSFSTLAASSASSS